jgi:hypothetical protein
MTPFTPCYGRIGLLRLARSIGPLIIISVLAVSLAAQPDTTQFDSLSLSSLKIELYSGRFIGAATGFIVRRDGGDFLITNWHVVTGRHPKNDSLILKEKPESLAVWLPLKMNRDNQLRWIRHLCRLFGNDGRRLWIEHPKGRAVDVVALPLETLDSTKWLFPIDFDVKTSDVTLRVAMPVSIVGFPMGISGSGKLPIWKSGYLASEPDVDFENRPAMLVDARTISGMSGSPAFLRSYGSYLSKRTGGYYMGKTGTRFLGVYSGRLPVDLADNATKSDIGIIWKPIVIDEILSTVPR